MGDAPPIELHAYASAIKRPDGTIGAGHALEGFDGPGSFAAGGFPAPAGSSERQALLLALGAALRQAIGATGDKRPGRLTVHLRELALTQVLAGPAKMGWTKRGKPIADLQAIIAQAHLAFTGGIAFEANLDEDKGAQVVANAMARLAADGKSDMSCRGGKDASRGPAFTHEKALKLLRERGGLPTDEQRSVHDMLMRDLTSPQRKH